jgi:hypothetical protein
LIPGDPWLNQRVDIVLAPRPQLSKPRDRYIYYPDCAEVPESVTPNIRNRSYAIAVEVKIESPQASGVLFSQGSRFGGHALYMKSGSLKYVYNWVGEFEQIVESSKPIPAGDHVLSASFVKEGDAMPTEGTLTLYLNAEKIGEGKIKTQPGKFSLAGEGLNVGKEGAEPVTDDYPGTSPWPSSAAQSARRRSTSPVTRGSISRRRWPANSHATEFASKGVGTSPHPV